MGSARIIFITAFGGGENSGHTGIAAEKVPPYAVLDGRGRRIIRVFIPRHSARDSERGIETVLQLVKRKLKMRHSARDSERGIETTS